ncbi:ArnT family glycosyltransferase [Dyadobacter sandarakinus]|uniref:Glycosyltransferase family 39 protein n=1 Tax=Dyadobacter sandarakinus TaxID=2747268 RepID=A0ABX7I567_9BACT|nr:glycosyltransferase family 39 protein [Dyadobacter sandarakinus]QRR01085.1 glycosyltransferase family 39 protein [Dyadobacter sandarakinus]
MLIKELHRIMVWGVLASLIVNMLSWPLNVMEGDAAYYAAASLEMIKQHEYFHFIDFDQTHPGLAPLSFWFSHFMMSLLGPGNIALHLPGLLLTLLMLVSVYRFALLYYSRETASLSVLVTATLQSTFILNRTGDPVTGLAAFYMFTVWQAALYYRNRKLQNLVLSIIGAILAMLSRGTYTGIGPGTFYQFTVTFWAFAPWIIWLILAIYDFLAHIRSGQGAQGSFIGVVLAVPFLLFLFNPAPSRYDLFALYPLAAILTAAYIVKTIYIKQPAWYPRIYYGQVFLLYAWLSVLFAAVWFPFPDGNYFGLIHFMAMLSALTYLVFFSNLKHKLLISCTIAVVGTNLVLNTYFYPNLLTFQAGARLGAIAKANGITEGQLYTLGDLPHYALHFYSGVRVKELHTVQELQKLRSVMVYMDQQMLQSVRSVRPDVRILGTNADFHGSDIDFRFLNPDTRAQAASTKMLIGL